MSLQSEQLFNVNGLVAVITGGGTGIGLMMATALENNGATVYIVGRRLEVLQNAAKAHNKFGKIVPIQGDVTSRESLLSVVETVKKQSGYVDLLVNNSGVMYNRAEAPSTDDDIKSFQSKLWNAGTPEEFTRTFEVNVAAVYYATVAFLELLDAGNKRPGRAPDAPTSQVVSISSIGGFRRDDATFSVSYSASKAAVVHIGKVLANTLRKWQIRSNIIAPGIYPSEMTQSLVQASERVPPDVVPLGRFGTPEDVGGLIVFLASRAGAYVNGSVHLTDGGRLGLFASTY